MRRRSEAGATMVEAAIVSLVFFFLVLMVFQGALFGRAYLAASDAVSEGARAGAVGGNDILTDYDILHAVNRSLSGSTKSDLVSVVVFQASAPNYGMPESCKTGPSSMCNRYTIADLNRIPEDYGPAGWNGDDNWPSANRFSGPGTSDKLGVYVEIKSGGLGGPLPKSVSKTFLVDPEPK